MKFSGKRVVVTAAPAFIGSHVVDHLVEADADVLDEVGVGTRMNLSEALRRGAARRRCRHDEPQDEQEAHDQRWPEVCASRGAETLQNALDASLGVRLALMHSGDRGRPTIGTDGLLTGASPVP
jgi:nucleoside-diphosphate-sugar epimerase